MAFTATRGWDRYTDLAQAHAALEKQVRAALATVVDRVVAMQRDKIEQAWIEFELERALPGRAQRLADRLRAAIDLADVLDVEAILGLREARLRIALENERLLTVPPSLAADWRRSRAEYMDTLQAMADRQALAGVDPPTELHDYAIGQLEPVLKALGVAEHPRDITLTLDRSLDPAARLASLTALIYGPEPLHASLIDAAYSNVPAVGADRFSAHGKDGHLIPAFSDPYIRAVLNRLDIHTHYQTHLLGELRDGPQAALRRRGFRESRMARMRHDAVEARVASLRHDYGEARHLGLTTRGHARVDALLDALGQGQPSPALVRQVTFRDMPLRDVMQIAESPDTGAPDSASAALVYYTPDAPMAPPSANSAIVTKPIACSFVMPRSVTTCSPGFPRHRTPCRARGTCALMRIAALPGYSARMPRRRKARPRSPPASRTSRAIRSTCSTTPRSTTRCATCNR